MKQKIFLVRHGQTDWNLDGKLTSDSNIPLNDTGLAQAEIAARNLASIRFDEIRCSEMLRANQTAQKIRDLQDGLASTKEIQIDPRLNELSFGGFEGLTRGDMDKMGLRQEFENWTRGRTPSEKGESLESASDRARSIFSSILSSDKESVLLVSHGHFLRILICCCALGVDPGIHRSLQMDNALYSLITIERDDIRLAGFNQLGQL